MLRFYLFVLGVMVASTSTAGDVSQCLVDTVPIQIVNEGSSPVTTLSAAKQAAFFPREVGGGGGPHFRAFVAAVTEHVAARLGKDKLCLDSAENKEGSLLQFMRWTIFRGNGPITPVTSLDARPSNGCRITSPWIDLAIERKPVPWIRGIVRWNERQLLADQAVLAGAKNVPPGVAKPLTNSEFGAFMTEYTGWRYRGEQTAKPIEERIPPDILWLLKHSPNGPMPFVGFVRKTMGGVREKGAEGYTKTVLALIDRCLASGGEEIRYHNILDVADTILFEQYKIDMCSLLISNCHKDQSHEFR